MNASANGESAPEVDRVVTLLRDEVLTLSAQVSPAPASIRLSARDVTVEVVWSQSIASSPQASPLPASAALETPAEPVQRTTPAAPEATTFALCSPTVGVFYRAPEPGAKPFVAENDVVQAGQQVAILEAMKLMIPVEADRGGRVVELLVDDGASVEHGQPLMLLEPTT